MTDSLEDQLDLGQTDFQDAEGSPKTALLLIGILLLVAGFAISFFGVWIYDPTVSSSTGYGERIYNNGLLNRQAGIIVFGSTLSIVGSVLYVGGRILEKIKVN